MKIETHDGYLEIERDDLNVFEESRSAIVLKLASDYGDEFTVDDFGPTLLQFEGRMHSETLLAFPMQAARKLHEELGRLIGATP